MGDYVQTGCLILGILCFFYYFIIVTYAGITADFAWIWAAAGIVFLGIRGLLACEIDSRIGRGRVGWCRKYAYEFVRSM